jgi:hypothetical protein
LPAAARDEIRLLGTGGLPHQPENPILKSGDPGDTEYQCDDEGCLRTDAIKNAS